MIAETGLVALWLAAALALAQSDQQHHPQRAHAVLLEVNRTAAASPETVWLALVWSRKNADAAAVQRYAAQLQRQFPSSPQWQAYQREAFDE